MNYVSLMGRLTSDPELKQSSNGTSYCRFSLAVKKDFVKDGVDFINCITFNKTSEFVAQYFKKGNRMLVEGQLSTNTFEKDGVKRTTTDVMVNRVHFIESSSNTSNTTTTTVEQNDYLADDEDEDDVFPF